MESGQERERERGQKEGGSDGSEGLMCRWMDGLMDRRMDVLMCRWID